MTQVSRPDGSGRRQTDVLMVMVYPCGKDIVLRRKFDWSYVWPEKATTSLIGGDEKAELSARHLSSVFYENWMDEDFGALDDLIEKWNNPTERDTNGGWKLDVCRNAFLNSSSEIWTLKGSLQRIQRWREFNPKSAEAVVAEAQYWVAYAWHIRGRETSGEVDPVAIRVFGERMKRAEKILKDSKGFASANPLWYEAYLDIAIATKRDEEFIENLYTEAIRRHPYFQPLYLDMAKYWAPRSREKANWEKVDEVVNQAVALTHDIDGISNYALLYAQINDLQKYEFNIFQDSFVSWTKMKDSFEDLVQHYPSSDNLNEFAAFACQAGDKETFLTIRAKILNRIVPYKWPGNYSLDLCDHRFMKYT